jgi:hypothetical protein
MGTTYRTIGIILGTPQSITDPEGTTHQLCLAVATGTLAGDIVLSAIAPDNKDAIPGGTIAPLVPLNGFVVQQGSVYPAGTSFTGLVQRTD